MNFETIDRIDLRTLQCFERVAVLGSFSAASRQLQIPRAAVSRLILKLEEQIGTKLFQRTTRTVSLTNEGQALVDAALPALSHLRLALRDASTASAENRGTVSFSVSRAFADRFVVPALPDFIKAFPYIRLNMSVTDGIDDLVSESLDFSIRIGELPDSSLITRKLADIEVVLAIPMSLLKGRKPPATLLELEALPQIAFQIPGTQRIYRWHFERDGQVHTQTPGNPHITSDSIEHIAQMVCDGIGISPLPRYLVADQLESGAVTIGLSSFRLPSLPLHLCFPGRGKRPARVDALANHLTQHIKKALG